eukprot:TRINITY_DN3807_c0_g4_i1.p1 TRINITY_DN3807_c0_g4~~TRINITY_DN3807_c0_g4_i1.p1  ORF type:complete len:549 (+),score=54.04 TRINITY_DN3807_c0_g4_i1:103-1749(+)
MDSSFKIISTRIKRSKRTGSAGHVFRRYSTSKGHHTHQNYHLPHAFHNHRVLPQDPKRPLSVRHPVDHHVITQFSYVYGSKQQPLLNDTVASVIEKGVAKFGYGKELLRVVHQDIRWSWGELKDHSDALARGLIRLGYQKGDRLGVWLPNSAEWAMAQYACATLGLVLVNLNPAYRTSEIEHAIKLVGMKGIIITPQLKTSNYIELLNEIIPELRTANFGDPVQSTRFPTLKHIISTGSEHYHGIMNLKDILMAKDHSSATSSEELQRILRSVDPDEPHNIQFTSGTTGLPKGATLSHRNVVNNGYFIGQHQRLGENDAICVPVPLFHCFGMVIGNLAAFTHGSKLVYPSAIFDPKAVLEAVQAEKCTALYGVPTMFLTELDHPDFKNYDVSSLRTGVMAGTTCPAHLMKRVVNEMNMKDVTICYGMTETSPVSFQTEPEDSFEKRTETVGTVHEHVECKVVDSDGNVVPIGTPGELLTKGYVVMLGYWNDEKRTKESIKHGWMHTGDLATIDKDGYCRIVGRIKDLIIRGGENVFPREVDDYLIKHL